MPMAWTAIWPRAEGLGATRDAPLPGKDWARPASHLYRFHYTLAYTSMRIRATGGIASPERIRDARLGFSTQ
jgi:hypothetical protein